MVNDNKTHQGLLIIKWKNGVSHSSFIVLISVTCHLRRICDYLRTSGDTYGDCLDYANVGRLPTAWHFYQTGILDYVYGDRELSSAMALTFLCFLSLVMKWSTTSCSCCLELPDIMDCTLCSRINPLSFRLFLSQQQEKIWRHSRFIPQKSWK